MVKMNKYILCFLACVLLVSCQKTKEEYFPSGSLKSKIEYKGDKKEGLAVYYDEGGVKILEMTMKNDKKEGRLRKFFFNGNIDTEEFYRNDVLDGKQTTYDVNGIKTSETNFSKGKKNGAYC